MSQAPAQDPAPAALKLEDLQAFIFERVLSESTLSGSIYLLGKIHDDTAILLVQRTQIAGDAAPAIVQGGLSSLNVFLENKPYFSAHANLLPSSLSDLKITAIWPAGPEHIKKYSAQEHVMFNETQEVYEKVVLPYIESIPASRISWVYNILAGEKEAERVLYRDEDPDKGFVLLPDLKWDQTSMNAMYLTAITQTRSIRSMRDLTREHLPLLRNIKAKVEETVLAKFGVDKGKLRLFVHYQPTYYHFHVHIVHIAHEGFAGMWVGKAHLLDDLVSLLELSPEDPAESILRRMTLTYALGTNHPLCGLLQAHAITTTASSTEASAAALGQ